jgi:hypothetical protein
LRLLSVEEPLIQQLFSEILGISGIRNIDWSLTSPEVIERAMRVISEALNEPDPFRDEKRRQNGVLLDVYPVLREKIENSEDPLLAAVQLSILGNAVDFMMAQRPEDVGSFLLNRLSIPLSREKINRLRTRLSRTRFMIYFADNCGEIVLDRLLIETIRREFDMEILVVVRSVPTLNDATLSDAGAIGFGPEVELIENGIKGPLPGTILNRCSSHIRRIVNKAELIISKGGGNFDTLGEENEQLDKIVFMLLSKCHPYTSRFHIPLHHPILHMTKWE